MLKFIESDASGLPRKRKQVSQACEPCRRRKKRCHHVHDSTANHDSNSTLNNPDSIPDIPAATATHARRPSDAPSATTRWPSQSSSHGSSVAWKDPNPTPPSASSTTAATTNTTTTRVSASFSDPPHSDPIPGHDLQRTFSTDRLSWRDASKPRPRPHPLIQGGGGPNRFVGDTNPEGLFIEASSPRSSRDNSGRGGVGVWQAPTDRPDAAANANDDAANFSRTRLAGPHRIFQEMAQKYVYDHCLTCRPPAADYAALRQIYLTKLDPIFPALSEPLSRQPLDHPADVVVQQVVSLAAASDPAAAKHLRLGTGTDLLDCGSFCASLSSAVQGALDAGIVTDRVLLTRILMVFSLYMQPPGPEDADLPAMLHSQAVHQMVTLGVHLELGDKDPGRKHETCTLFCCVWALDRMSAAFYGRACLMHERDFGWDLAESIARQAPAFRLFLMIIQLMDDVFALYRPIVKVQEALIVEMPIFEQLIIDADANKVSDATLASIEVFYHAVAILSCRYPEGSKESAMPAPATNSRRSLSADRITSIVGQEFQGRLTYLPFIPYAVSLSLSVAYRKMRFSSVPMFRQRGRRAFRENTVMLRVLGDTFWTAKTLAAMAEKMLREMDKATASLMEGEMNSSGTPVAARGSNGGEAGGVGVVVGSTAASDVNASVTAANSRTGSIGVGDGSVGMEELSGRPPGAGGAYGGENMVDVRDIDIFASGHLDPAFDIGAVGAALECNLDFGTSSNWFDMQQLWG